MNKTAEMMDGTHTRQAVFKKCRQCLNNPEPVTTSRHRLMACQCVLLPVVERVSTEELWDALPGCTHDIQAQPGGGIRCTKCNGWFCF